MSWSPTVSASCYQHAGFWKRQFGTIETESQAIFDVVFGLIAPVVVLIVDPVVFQGGFMPGRPLMPNYQGFAYLFCGLEMGLFLVWRSWHARITSISAGVGGALLGGSIFSLVMGVVLLPFTLMGLLILIGAVGFIPFLTGFVYLRSGVRAIKAQEKILTSTALTIVIVAALMSSVVSPYAASVVYSRLVSDAVTELIYSEDSEAQVAVNCLRRFPLIPASERERILQTYRMEKHAEKKEMLREYWKGLTGEELDDRLNRFGD